MGIESFFPVQESAGIKKMMTVEVALLNRWWVRIITGGILVDALVEYLRLWETLEQIHLQEGVQDRMV